jgi:23S rRNA C2498 (ribose-2'-O)-methylase RlmM
MPATDNSRSAAEMTLMRIIAASNWSDDLAQALAAVAVGLAAGGFATIRRAIA